MSPLVITLVLVSASLHVWWNTLAKASRDSLSLAWLSTVLGAVALAVPFAVARVLDPGPLTGEIWLWAGVSGLAQGLYVAILFAAYAVADLTVVYPVSRGLGPLVVMALAGRLVGDGVTPAQAAAVCLVAIGTVAVGLTSRGDLGRFSPKGMLLAMATALCTAGYSLADRKAMSLAVPPHVLEYLFLSYVFLAVALTVLIRWGRPGWAGLCSEWGRSRRDVLVVALVTPLSYVCIVAALRIGNVVLVTAGRNVGILLSVVAGAFILGEGGHQAEDPGCGGRGSRIGRAGPGRLLDRGAGRVEGRRGLSQASRALASSAKPRPPRPAVT